MFPLIRDIRPRFAPTLPVLLALVVTAALLRPASAATINVPADQPTVRSAVSAAASGDTILIAPGTHDGGVFVNGKVITFASRYMLTGDTAFVAQTVIRGVVGDVCAGAPGCRGNSVLEFGNNAIGSRVIGLTLTAGENGVGSGSAVDIDRCRVIANGDGVDFTSGSGGAIRDCLFANNSDDGIDLNGHMNMAIRDNVIRDNNDDGIEYRVYSNKGPGTQVDILGNRITGNREDGIQLIDYPAVSNVVVRIEGNLFAGNFDAAGLSAAVACMPDGQTIESLIGAPMPERVYVINNTFVGEQNGVVGGANVIALNNIFKGTQGSALRRVGGSSIASYTMFWNNAIDHEESAVDLPHVLNADPALDASGSLTAVSPAINAGTAFFEWQGATVLNRPPSSYAGSAPDLGAFEYLDNVAPTVNAGADQNLLVAPDDVVELGRKESVTLRMDVLLDGTVTDDGQPIPPVLTTTWSFVSGPGPVTFENANLVDTRATITAFGTYVLRLTASDGELSGTDTVRVTVLPPTNTPPVVDAGHNQTVALDAEVVEMNRKYPFGFRSQVVLDGTVTDDGLPSPPALTSTWTVVSGPGAVIIQDPRAVDTQATLTTIGTYVLRLTADDGALSASDSVLIVVQPVTNMPPLVDAGGDQTVTLPADAVLDGMVNDDGEPHPASLTATWSVGSGPGPVTFHDANVVDTQASFTTVGSYVLRLTASDGALSTTDSVAITVLPVPNAAPGVDAGAAQTITLPSGAALDGTVSDDGLPSPPTLTTTWSVGSGPGPVTFQDAKVVDTQASFSTEGTYLLRLTATDGALSTTDSVAITVLPVPNAAPVVDAGADRTIKLPASAALDGTVTDDGLPKPPALTTTWSVGSGPGPVNFDYAIAVDTRAWFTIPGTYMLRLTASDGALSSMDSVQIIVLPPPPPIERRIVANSDDAEERANGLMDRNVFDLDLVYDSGDLTVGLRFTNLTIPPGATITQAYVQFEAQETQSEITDLRLDGQAADDPPTFSSARYDVSSRPRTAASVNWSPSPWTVVGEAGLAERTPDLKYLVQETVDRPGWASGNALAFIITGTGHRTARSHEGDPSGAALLHVEYVDPIAQLSSRLPTVASAAPRLEFGILALTPQPAHGELHVDFTFAEEGPGRVELLDLAGRRVMSREVGGLGIGRHRIDVRDDLPAGVYLVRLTQGRRAQVKKAVVLR